MPKTILDRYNDAGDAGKLGSSSIPTRPLKKVHLVPVWDTDNNVGRVVKASDLLTDNPAFVMTMVMSGAYSIVLGTAVYDEETPPNLVSAEIQWADGTAGTIERKIIDGNGSTEDTFSRIIPGATTQWYKHTTLYDDDGTVKGGGFMAAGDGLAVLTVTGTLLPFVVYEGDTPDLGETNTGIQAIKLETTNTEELVKVVPPSGWKVSSDEGVHWKDELSLDCSDSGVTIWVRLKETVVGAYAGTLSISVGIASEELSLTGYICDGDIAAGLPYYILLPQQLDAVRDHLDADHEQVADIDLSAYTNWVPIGESGGEFTGTYNGGGHKITGLVSAPTTGEAGLFGYLSGATIQDLVIEAGDVAASANSRAGMLAASGGGTLSGIVVSGTVEGGAAGGLVGYFVGAITDCGADVAVNGLSALSTVGGLIGYFDGSITESYALGNVTGVASTAGGLVGTLLGDTAILDCYSTGAVSATADYSGGIAGLTSDETATIVNCYSAGAITNGTVMGGIIGDSPDQFDPPSFVTCVWNGDSNAALPTGQVGGDTSYGGVEATIANMRKAATYTALGWDFTALTGEWTIDEDNDYPRLAWE
jgi:hypothetical protein